MPRSGPTAFPRVVELLLYGVGPLATLATAPILAQGLGPIGRGQYGVALAVSGFAVAAGSWGQGEIYLARSRDGTAHYPHHASITWVAGFAAAVLAAITIGLLGVPWWIALLTAVWIPIISQVSLWRAQAVSRQELKSSALDNSVGSFLRVAALAVLFGLALLTVESAITAVQGAIAVGSILTVGLAIRRSKPKWVDPLLSNRRTLIAGGGSIVGFNLLHAISLRGDLVILQVVSTPLEVGLYAAPASVTTASLALAGAYRPRIQAATFSASPLRHVLREALQVLVLSAIAATALWLLVPFLVPILFGPEFLAAQPLMRLLAIAIVPLVIMDIGFGGLVVLGRRRELIWSAAVGAVVLVVMMIILGATLGATGAAIACIVSYTVGATVVWVVLIRILRRENGVSAPTGL